MDAAITTTERSLASYVSEYVRRQVAAARERIQQYGDRCVGSAGGRCVGSVGGRCVGSVGGRCAGSVRHGCVAATRPQSPLLNSPLLGNPPDRCSYLATTGAALNASQRGSDARAAALVNITSYCDRLAALRARLAALQVEADASVPENTSAGLFEQVSCCIPMVYKYDYYTRKRGLVTRTR